MLAISTIIAIFGFESTRSVVASAIIPPRPGSSWGRLSELDDVPIIGDNFFGREKRGRRRRRHTSTSHDNKESDDSDDDTIPPYFLDREGNSRWREQYEFDRMQRRRYRNESRKNNEADCGISSSLNNFREWTFAKTGIYIPRINCHFDPITILKIRKSWHNVIPGAIIRVGADFETQHRLGRGIWRLRGCLEDKFLGGRFTLKGKRNRDKGVIMEYSKSWLFQSTGSLGTRFNLCAQYDPQYNRGSARFGFRTESVNTVGSTVSSPGLFGDFSRRQGLTIVPIIPLDGPDGHFKLEAKTTIELPEPEITVGVDLAGISVDGGSVGMGISGDVDVEMEELNVICHF